MQQTALRLVGFFLLTLAICTTSQAATITAIASGNWGTNSTWSCNCQPTNADNIIIPAGITVTANGPEILFLGPVITITISGTLVLNNASLQIDSSDIVVINTGGKITGTGLTGGAVYSGVIPMFIPNGSSITGPKKITNGTLPVTLLFFKGMTNENKVTLQWASASELNLDYYEVLRSGDGIHYDTLGRVQGNGTTAHRTDYKFDDGDPLIKNYYTLRTVDIDGSAKSAETILIEIQQTRKFEVYPNPVSGTEIFVRTNFMAVADDKFDLYDYQGTRVLEQNLTEAGNEHAIPFPSSLANGIYYILLKTAGGTYRTRIVINN